MKDFYLIGDLSGMIEKKDVTKAEWDALWPWACKKGIAIYHYRVMEPYRLLRIRWRARA
jgi:hypothetical protein